jgi:hypothetical protein
MNSLQAVPGLQLPVSYSQEIPTDSLMLVISPEAITFENEKVLEFESTAGARAPYEIKSSDLDEGGLRIAPLYDLLTQAKERGEIIRAKSKMRDAQGNPLPFEGVLAIQADKKVNYQVVRKVMYTAGTAGFKVFRFLAMQKEDH